MKYKNMIMNEMDLIESFSMEELKELLQIQIEEENYEGAQVVKSAIDQYHECVFDINLFDADDYDGGDPYEHYPKRIDPNDPNDLDTE